MALPTSNLSMNLILQTLGVLTAKDIFYFSGLLRTKAQLEGLVNKDGLSPAHCPGITDDDRITNLLNDRKLSYFKGYEHITDYLSVAPTSLNFGSVLETIWVNVTSNTNWSVSDSASWITVGGYSGSGNSSMSINCETNTGSARSGTVTITWSGGSAIINIYQEADGGDPCGL